MTTFTQRTHLLYYVVVFILRSYYWKSDIVITIPFDLFLIYCIFCLHLFLLRYVFSDLQEVAFLFHQSSPNDHYTKEQDQFIYKQIKTDLGHQPEPLRLLSICFYFIEFFVFVYFSDCLIKMVFILCQLCNQVIYLNTFLSCVTH